MSKKMYILGLILFVAFIGIRPTWKSLDPEISRLLPAINRSDLMIQLGEDFKRQNYLPQTQMKIRGEDRQVRVEYTLDNNLQNEAQKLLNRYKPDYGVIVVMKPNTGQILALVSYERNYEQEENWALKATFPVASVFKVITATAAIEKSNFSPEDRVSFNGGFHTLYKRNVFEDKINRWTHWMTFRQAFARSINTVFGKIGFHSLSPEDLLSYAVKFKFNQPIYSDLPVETGMAHIPMEKSFAVAEVAAGYTRNNLMSPVHGALIAGAVVENGTIMEPYIVERVLDDEGSLIYQAEKIVGSVAMNQETSLKMRELMQETVITGTSRRHFRQFFRDYQDVEVGGKTGNLTSQSPRGRCDWFVGYAMRGDEKLAIATLTLNKKYWTVKSSYLAQSLIREYFSE